MTGSQSEIIILIDTSAFNNREWKSDLIDHVKEAVSFQISRGAITNRKLIRLGLEPYLARVKWTYIFFDSTHTPQQAVQKTASSILGQSMQTLTYECWDLFEQELNSQVKSNPPKDINIPVNHRMKNVIRMLQNLKFPYNWPNRIRCSNPDLPTTSLISSSSNSTCSSASSSSSSSSSSSGSSVEKFIIVFTTVPKITSCLVHLAVGITSCKYSMSLTANCSPTDIQICFVDVTFDSVSFQEHHGSLGKLPCFWDDVCSHDNNVQQLCEEEAEEKLKKIKKAGAGAGAGVGVGVRVVPDKKLSLKVTCLRKIMMIHKLMEMRFPWMYDHSLPFGFGLGMKRLRQWEWRIPQEIPRLPQDGRRRRGCLSLRKCCSEEMYCERLL